jgi:hypothetical protein
MRESVSPSSQAVDLSFPDTPAQSGGKKANGILRSFDFLSYRISHFRYLLRKELRFSDEFEKVKVFVLNSL